MRWPRLRCLQRPYRRPRPTRSRISTRARPSRIVVGHEVGTGFDIYARVLQRHLGRHIPGNPAVVVQNMIGASGIAAGQLALQRRAQGRHGDGDLRAHGAVRAADGQRRRRFEPAKFTWIGNMEESVAICGVSKAAGIATFDDMRTQGGR